MLTAFAAAPEKGAPPGGKVPSPVKVKLLTKGPLKVAFTIIPGCCGIAEFNNVL